DGGRAALRGPNLASFRHVHDRADPAHARTPQRATTCDWRSQWMTRSSCCGQGSRTSFTLVLSARGAQPMRCGAVDNAPPTGCPKCMGLQHLEINAPTAAG